MESGSTSTAGSTVSLRLALRRSRRLRWVLAGIVVMVVAFGILAYLLLQPASTPSTATQRFNQAALRYAGTQIVWSTGPAVKSTHILPLRDLAAALKTAVRPSVARDVNTSDLIRRYGPDHEVALVVLAGDFNSLPPDEGLVLNGELVVLVDTARDRAIYLNY
jgi:hypothetical protein